MPLLMTGKAIFSLFIGVYYKLMCRDWFDVPLSYLPLCMATLLFVTDILFIILYPFQHISDNVAFYYAITSASLFMLCMIFSNLFLDYAYTKIFFSEKNKKK